MGITVVTSRAFNQDVSKAKRDASKGPVFITDRGRAAHVLLSIEDYRKITEKDAGIVDLLAMPEGADIDFEPVRSDRDMYRTPDLS